MKGIWMLTKYTKSIDKAIKMRDEAIILAKLVEVFF